MTRAQTAAFLALIIAPYFIGLSRPDLWDANESLYAEPPREALETGEWLVPTMNYEPWFVKPPGVTWVTIPFYAAFGPSEFSGRLPMAIAAALTILMIYRIGTLCVSERAGLLSAIVLATTAKHFMFARQLAGDIFIMTCFVGAAWGYLSWFLSGGDRRGGLWAGAAALGVGMLMKGPVALLLPGLVLVVHLCLARRRDLFSKLKPWGPLALMLVVGVPWFVYVTLKHGDAFTSVYFGQHHFGRFFTDIFGGSRGPLFYPKAFVGEGLPWSLALPGALWGAWRIGVLRREPWLFSVVWSVVLVLFFTFATGKRSVYLLPVYPFVGLLVGATLDRVEWPRARWIVGPLMPVSLLAAAATVYLVSRIPIFLTAGVGVGLIACGWAAALLVALRRERARTAVLWTGIALACLGVWIAVNLRQMQSARPAREFAEYVARHAEKDDRAGRYWVGLQSLTFYGRRPFFSLRDADALRRVCRDSRRTWIVLPEELLGDLSSDPGLTVEVVLRRPYLQVSTRALRGRKPLERTLVLAKVTPTG